MMQGTQMRPTSMLPAVRSNAAIDGRLQSRSPQLTLRKAGNQRGVRHITAAKLERSQFPGQPPAFTTVDILSSGLGALVCTSFFVSRGQDPFEALSITACSMVVALVLNQLFDDK